MKKIGKFLVIGVLALVMVSPQTVQATPNLVLKDIYGVPDFGPAAGGVAFRAFAKLPDVVLPAPGASARTVVGMSDELEQGLGGAYLQIKLNRLCLFDPCILEANQSFSVSRQWCNSDHSFCSSLAADNPPWGIAQNKTYRLAV